MPLTAKCAICQEPFKLRSAPLPSALCKACRRERDTMQNRLRVQKHRATASAKCNAPSPLLVSASASTITDQMTQAGF